MTRHRGSLVLVRNAESHGFSRACGGAKAMNMNATRQEKQCGSKGGLFRGEGVARRSLDECGLSLDSVLEQLGKACSVEGRNAVGEALGGCNRDCSGGGGVHGGKEKECVGPLPPSVGDSISSLSATKEGMRAKKLAVKTLKKLFPETAAYEEGVTRGNENAQNIQPESCLSFLCEPQSTATNPVLEASTLMENSSTPEKVAEGVFVEEAEKRRVYPDDALIQELQRQVEEIKLIVQQNIAIATANREHAEVLKKKSEGLKFHSSLFKKKGEQLKNHFWRQNATLIIIIALIVVAVAIVLAMILGAMTAMIVVSLL